MPWLLDLSSNGCCCGSITGINKGTEPAVTSVSRESAHLKWVTWHGKLLRTASGSPAHEARQRSTMGKKHFVCNVSVSPSVQTLGEGEGEGSPMETWCGKENVIFLGGKSRGAFRKPAFFGGKSHDHCRYWFFDSTEVLNLRKDLYA